MLAVPKRIGGKDEEPSGGLTVILGMRPKMPKRIGGPSDEEEETSGEGPDGDQIKLDAAEEAIDAIAEKDAQRFLSAITSIVRAVDAEPEGEKRD